MLYKRGLLASFATAIFSLAPMVQAAPIYSVSAPGLAAAQAAETDFLSSLASGYVTENFEGYAAKTLSKDLNTAVGTFSQVVAGSGGSCTPNCADGVAVLDKKTTPFQGRYAIDGMNWLDSWDSKQMRLTLTQPMTMLGFYITDPNDVGGRLAMKVVDNNDQVLSISDILSGAKKDGQVYFLSFFALEGIKYIDFLANSSNDGYGIDRITIGHIPSVPEPATLALMSLGLVSVGLSRRRKS